MTFTTEKSGVSRGTGFALAAAVFAAPGCLASRTVSALGDDERAELAAIRERLRERHVRIIAPLESDWREARRVLGAFDAVGMDSHRLGAEPLPGDVTLSSREEADAGSFALGMLSLATLGLIPYRDDNRAVHVISWTRGARWTTDRIEESAPTITGWIAPLVALSEDWQLGGSPEDSAEARAALEHLGLQLARSLDRFTRDDPAAGQR